MLLDPLRRAARRLDSAYTEDLVRVHRAADGTGAWTPVVSVPRIGRTTAPRIAVVAHAFYPELLEQLRRALDHLPPRPDVFVSVPSKEIRIQALAVLERLDAGLLDVRVVDNRGRDIAPKYVTFADVYGRGYDLLLFLHTKKSLTADFGDDWRDQLFRSLVGSPEVVDGVIGMFAADPRLGVVAPGHHEAIGRTTGWDGNYSEARRLARRAGLKVHRWAAPDFPSGSMFWARPEALVDLTGLGLRIEEFPAETGQVGFTVMHALERMVFVAAEHAGFHSVMVTDPEAPAATAPNAASARVSAAVARRPAPPVFIAAGLLTSARLVRTAVRRVGRAASDAVSKRVYALPGRFARGSAQHR